MNEPTPLDRVVMVLKTVASIATWVVAIGFGFIRGKVQAPSHDS